MKEIYVHLTIFCGGDSILRGNIAVVVLEVFLRDRTAVAHIFHSEENANPDFIFLVALGGHLRWAKPSDRGTKNTWGELGKEYVQRGVPPV